MIFVRFFPLELSTSYIRALHHILIRNRNEKNIEICMFKVWAQTTDKSATEMPHNHSFKIILKNALRELTKWERCV